MTYQVRTTKKFDKSFKKLDRQSQKLIKNWMDGNLIACQDPRFYGKASLATSKGYGDIGSLQKLTTTS